MVEDVSTSVGCKKYISMVESAVKKISEQRKVSRHQEGLWIGHSPRMSLQRIRLRIQAGYHYLSGIIKLKKLDSHSLNILAATFYEHHERMDKKRHQMIFQMMSLLHSIRVIPLGFEPKTHSLEGCCSNPTELRNQLFDCKSTAFIRLHQIIS